MRSRSSTDGFVLVDALVAVALVASAGTVAYLIGHQLLAEQDRRLDRLAALINMRALIQEITLTGIPSDGETVMEEAGFSYLVLYNRTASDNRQLVALTIEAHPSNSGEVSRLSFLAPVPVP